MFRASLRLQGIETSTEAVEELERIYSSTRTLGEMDRVCKESEVPGLSLMSWSWRTAVFQTAQSIQSGAASAERTAEMYPRQASNFPYLRIWMILDGCMRSPHAWLDGFAAKWDDEVWKVLIPPFGWECGCMIRMMGRPVQSESFEPALPGIDRVPKDVLRAATDWMDRNPRYLWDRTIVPKRPHVPAERWPEDPDFLKPTEKELEILRSYGISVTTKHID